MGKTPQQKKVAFIDQCPTEQAVRRNEERKVREEKLAERGTIAAETEVARKREKFKLEGHQGDRGSDLDPFEEAPMQTALAVEGSMGSAIACSFFGHNACCSGSADPSEEEMDKALNDNFSLRYFVYSDGSSCHASPPPRSVEIQVKDLCTHLDRSELSGTVDVMELFGGEIGVGKLCVWRRQVRGGNVRFSHRL